MSHQPPESMEKLQSTMADVIHQHWKVFLVQGLVMIVLGLLAVALPQIATLAVEILIGWLFIVGGVFRLMSVLKSRQAPGFWWSLLTAVLAIVVGVLLVAQPLAGVLTLTMVLIILFAVEGIAAIVMAFQQRDHMKSWGWVLVSGIVNLGLAVLVWIGWPETASWVIGLMVGINMMFVGLSLTMTAIAARTKDSEP